MNKTHFELMQVTLFKILITISQERNYLITKLIKSIKSIKKRKILY